MIKKRICIYGMLVSCCLINIAWAGTFDFPLTNLKGMHNAANLGCHTVHLFDPYTVTRIESLSISFSGYVNVQPDWIWLSISTPESSETVQNAINVPETGAFEISNRSLSPGGIVDGN